MKQRILIRLFKKNGWILYGHGGEHDIYSKGKEKEYIPRHREINEELAKALIRKHNLK